MNNIRIIQLNEKDNDYESGARWAAVCPLWNGYSLQPSLGYLKFKTLKNLLDEIESGIEFVLRPGGIKGNGCLMSIEEAEEYYKCTSEEIFEPLIFEPLSGKNIPVLPCPFCGSKDIDLLKNNKGITIGEEFFDGNAAVVGCTNCGATGPHWDCREEQAIAGWNNRCDI